VPIGAAALAATRRRYLQVFPDASPVGFAPCIKSIPPWEPGAREGGLETETTPGFGRDGTSELRTGTYEMWEEVEEGEAKVVVADAGSVGILLAGAGADGELPSGQNVIRRSTYMCVET
jgi:hypothetical protein